MQKISKMTAANGRRWLTKNIDMLIININHDNSGRDMSCLKSIYKMSKSITPGGAQKKIFLRIILYNNKTKQHACKKETYCL